MIFASAFKRNNPSTESMVRVERCRIYQETKNDREITPGAIDKGGSTKCKRHTNKWRRDGRDFARMEEPIKW